MHGNDTMEVSFTLGAISEVCVNVLTGYFLLTPWPCVLELGHWYNGQSGQCSFSRTIAVARTQPPAHMLRTWYGGWLCTGSLSLAGWCGGTWHTLCLGLSTQPSPFSGRDLLNVVCYSMQIGHNRKLAPVDGLSQTFGDFFFFFFKAVTRRSTPGPHLGSLHCAASRFVPWSSSPIRGSMTGLKLPFPIFLTRKK